MTGQWTRILDFELASTRQPEGDTDTWEAAIKARMSHFSEVVLPEITTYLKDAVGQV